MFVRSAFISLTLIVTAQAIAVAPAAIKQSGHVTFDVLMKTTVTVPSTVTSGVKFWHALPTPRPWSMTGFELGAIAPTPSPEIARLVFDTQKNSYHFLWQFEGPFEAGKSIEASTRFHVNSCNRRFDAAASKTQWSDLTPAPPSTDAIPEVAALVERLRRRSPQPAIFVGRACEWIAEELTYDASAPQASNEVAETLRVKRGHCGHYYEVLRSLCEAAGLPIRRVFGLNLYSDDIRSEPLYAVRADYVNIHTWAEVELPKDGWIEVEPSQGKRAFAIPARFVQNNPWFQNYSVWVREGGEWRPTRWMRRDGGWDSDYRVEHAITFDEIPLGSGDPKRFPQQWNSKNGRFSVIGALVDFDDEAARLATSDGRQISVKWAALAETDRDRVRQSP